MQSFIQVQNESTRPPCNTQETILESIDFNYYFPEGDTINSLDAISKVCSTWAALRLICPPPSGAEIQENCQLMPSLNVLQYFHWQKHAYHELQRELSNDVDDEGPDNSPWAH